VFSPSKVSEAEAKFAGTTFQSPTHLTVRTFGKVPADRKADFDKLPKGDATAKHQFFMAWARELAQAERERGVFVLVSVEGSYVEVVVDEQTDLKRSFPDADARKLRDILVAGFKEASGAKDKSDADKKVIRGEALVKATGFVVDQLKHTSAPEASGTTHSTDAPKKAGWSIGTWICIGLCVLLAVWVVIALIRALTGMGGGGYGGGYGPGYGGGGGGFFSSFLGGMFGAAAGMWMYNSFFGGSSVSDMSAGESFGDGGQIDTGAGDFDGGAEAGGDWGDSGGGDAGGGDWGDAGGGGDWGGGGDFGGGGDW
jgi:uncharacterized protein